MEPGTEQPAVRVGPSTDDERFLATDRLVWAEEPSSLPTADLVRVVPPDQRFAAEADGTDPATYAGVFGVLPMTLSVPAGATGVRQVPCAGLSWVGVHPDQRRRGVLTAMLRHHFAQVRRSDAPVSALHASEPQIYGRHGYGLASVELSVTLGRGTTLVAPHLDEDAGAVETRTGSMGDPGTPERLRELELRLGRAALGAIVGPPSYYERICSPTPEEQRGKEPLRTLFARRDGVDVGVAAFRREQKWERGRPGGEVTVFGVFGDPAACLALLRRLVDLDLMGTVVVRRVSADDELLAWVGGPRAAGDVATSDNLWVRLVDLPAALEARGYAAPADVVVEVDDPAAPWNAGRWRITVGADGSAKVGSTSDQPDLRLPVSALGAAYLGAGSLLTLVRAGHVEELRPQAATELWRAFRTDVTPGPAIGF
jgi:GNAT superfamily N-acetyltransferase